MADKRYSAKEAAAAVLKKAEELYKASTLAKGDWAKIHSKLKREGYSEESADKIDGAIKAKMGKSERSSESQIIGPNSPKGVNRPGAAPGESHMGHSVRQGDMSGAKKVAYGTIKEQRNMPKPELGKSDEDGANPDAQADAQLGEKVEQDVQEHEAHNEDPEHHEKGSYKLAKFMGRRDHKKAEKAKAMEKGDGQTLGGAIGFPGAAQTAPMPAPAPSQAPGASMTKKDPSKV